RSIWESAASRAFDLSMEEPSTRRNAVVVIAPTPYRTGFAGPTTKRSSEGSNVHDLFSVRNMFFLHRGVLTATNRGNAKESGKTKQKEGTSGKPTKPRRTGN